MIFRCGRVTSQKRKLTVKNESTFVTYKRKQFDRKKTTAKIKTMKMKYKCEIDENMVYIWFVKINRPKNLFKRIETGNDGQHKSNHDTCKLNTTIPRK